MNKEVEHYLKSRIYFSLKDISLGINIFTNRDIVYGTKGRTSGIEINLIIFHFKIGVVRSGF